MILKHIRNSISLIIGLGLLIYLLTIINISETVSVIKNINLRYLLPYLAVSIAIFSGLVFRWYIILRTNGIYVNFIKLFFYRVTGFFVSYITPSAKLGGEGVRVYFLMKDYKASLERSLSSVVTDKIIELNTNAVFTVFAIFFFILNFSLPQNLKSLLIGGIIVIAFLIITYYYRMLNNKLVIFPIMKFFRLTKINIIKRHEHNIIEAERKMIDFHKHHRQEFIFCLFLSAILLIFSVYEFKILTLMFNYHISIITVFLILTVVGLATIIPIPAALGVLEGGQVSLFKIIGLNKNIGFSIGFLTRIRDIFWSIIGFSYLYYRNLRISNILQSGSTLKPPKRVEYFKHWRVK